MVLEFATKRDVNGNRYYLGIDTKKKSFSRERGRWYSREDITEIAKADRRKKEIAVSVYGVAWWDL